jgi:hypothetical protein
MTTPSLRLEWIEADSLSDNPGNWRRHPAKQLDALRDVLDEVGWAGALLFNERTSRLIDGHARKQVAAGKKVPVLVGNWSEEQERLILATLDPLANLAVADQDALRSLLEAVHCESDAVQQMLSELIETQSDDPITAEADDQSDQIPEQFQILITCGTEQQQAELLERFTAEGLQCRSLIS